MMFSALLQTNVHAAKQDFLIFWKNSMWNIGTLSLIFAQSVPQDPTAQKKVVSCWDVFGTQTRQVTLHPNPQPNQRGVNNNCFDWRPIPFERRGRGLLFSHIPIRERLRSRLFTLLFRYLFLSRTLFFLFGFPAAESCDNNTDGKMEFEGF